MTLTDPSTDPQPEIRMEPLPYGVDAYRLAPSDIGPLAAEWRDKPHRLVYDLVNEVKRLNLKLKHTRASNETA